MPGADTIAAVATPMGMGGIGIVRISGGQALQVADGVLRLAGGKSVLEMEGYTCAYGRVYDGEEPLDEVVATVFRAPHSYTGEDIVEIAAHGGPFLLGRILRACCGQGARPASAGEFTKRAFLNGKLDLTQAEAVMDLIAAQGSQAARCALSARDGALYQCAEHMAERLAGYASHLAAWIDYPEEEIVEVDGQQLEGALRDCCGELSKLLDSYDTGRVVREGIDVAIVGRPNTGKSTLMNLLAGYTRSIVTSLAGTTRDVVSDTIQLGDLLLHLSDTAGIRETEDPVERMGVDLAVRQIQRAQLVLAMFDGSEPLNADDQRVIASCRDVPCIALVNKSDLVQRLEISQLREQFERVVVLSAKSADGAQALKQQIEELFQLDRFDPSAALVANERQRAGISAARLELEEAADALAAGVSYDAVCVCIERAIDALYELTGKRASQEIVDQVFSRFCVGK